MIVAVDTGGTKTLVAVFDTEGRIAAEQKFPTPADRSEYVTQLKTTINSLVGDESPSCISVALPGSIRNGVMVWAANLAWEDTNIRALLADSYGCPIIVENDANLAGLAEARSLSDMPPVCLYATVSTGIGTGVILDGKIHPLLSRTEGGRMILNKDNKPAIWESFASGKAIHATYGKLASEIDDEHTWQIISNNIAQGLLAICPFLRPDIVIIGGGVSVHFQKFGPKLVKSLEANLHDGYMPKIVQAVHPEEAVIYGCYYHALDSVAD